MSRGLIVVDSYHPMVRQNRCFDPEYEYMGPGYAFNVRLAREAKKRDLEIVTADVYLENEERPSKKVVCLTDMVTQFTERLLAFGVQPAICFSFEPPLIARKFYHNMAKFAGRFHHNFQFRGTQERLAGSKTVFHPVVFPIDSRIPQILTAWNNRNYLIMVNSNKRATFNKWDNLRNIVHSTISHICFLALKITDPWMRIREIYVDRVKAIHHFSTYPDFSLYGYGWEKSIHGFGNTYQLAVRKSYNGVISSDVRIKREVMGGFKFSLCFENCIFPGYITEKIFDSFLAGCIPVYFGAPDITDFVPSETFIDFRLFGNYSDLDRFLRGMTESDANRYLDAAREFLAGKAFDKFTVDHFVNDILNVIEQELDK
ncbi:MAG: glycosyltransferase family 10 [Bacteroidia bacterium]|nr:glycosyltransferase family 10 [Bacteroidia bacterium]